MTKKLLIILLIVVIASGAILGFFWWQEKGGIQRVDWKTYRNEEYGFEVKYPEDWIVETKQIPVYPDTFTVMVELTAPLKDKQVFIAIRPKGDEGMIRKSFSIISEEKININGVTSSKITGVGQKEGFLRETFILVTRGPYLYQLKGEGEIFDQILSTFRFIEVDETADWKTYQNEEYGYEVKYPADWEGGEESTTTTYASFVPEKRDMAQTGFWIIVYENTNKLSPSEWWEQDYEKGAVSYLDQGFFNIAGENAKVFKQAEGRESAYYIISKNSRIYLISSQIIEEKLYQILSTFKFIE